MLSNRYSWLLTDVVTNNKLFIIIYAKWFMIVNDYFCCKTRFVYNVQCLTS